MRSEKNLPVVLFVVCVTFVFAGRGSAQEGAWHNHSSGMTERDTRCVMAPSENQPYLFAGTSRALYRAPDARSAYVPVLQLFGAESGINAIVSDGANIPTLYTATDNGAFQSVDGGLNWKAIFRPSGPLARYVYDLLPVEDALYAATAEGVYVYREQEWSKLVGELGQSPFYRLFAHEGRVVAVGRDEIFMIGDGAQMRIFSAVSGENDDEEIAEEETEPSRKRVIKDARSLHGDIYAATREGIIYSRDDGVTWESISVLGLPKDSVNRLWITHNKLYAATDRGVFVYTLGRWESALSGLSVLDVAGDGEGVLMAATNDGVYLNSRGDGLHPSLSYEDALTTLNGEPRVHDVHKMAIRYANVAPDQIRSWQRQSRMKALVPSVSVGLSRGDGELWHWDTGQNPDVLVKGREYIDWSTSLSWNLGDMIWNSSITSIDSRSKLMSELRQDILDQVTRIYFERRRIQIELVMAGHAQPDPHKELRVAELTAMLDGLTGGEFSRHARKISPEGQNIPNDNRQHRPIPPRGSL